ncbi:MAG: hypoxanthine phosphoribosyltransferase [Tissierellia bacterium]|nr:hypoxanthine phosphoribosyltransferase [Tissierellia bacterium]
MDDISRLDEIGEVLISQKEIDKKVDEIAKSITEQYKDDDAQLVLIGILKGSVIFLTDLCRKIELPLTFDFMSVSSYGDNTTSAGDVRILKDLDQKIEGKNVIIVEDIIDTGYTLSYLVKNLQSRGAKSIRIATLLNKKDRRIVDVDVDYIGFDIPDEFVVGYGIDYAQKYRNLPFIGIVKREVYE